VGRWWNPGDAEASMINPQKLGRECRSTSNHTSDGSLLAKTGLVFFSSLLYARYAQRTKNHRCRTYHPA
jgi:hypothetical protein